MDTDSFYQRLKFYSWLLNRPEGATFADFGEENGLASSTLARWHGRFDREKYVGIIAKQITAKSIRDQILKAIQNEAIGGNIQAAKLVLTELEEVQGEGEAEVLTVDKAVKIIRELVHGEETKGGGV